MWFALPQPPYGTSMPQSGRRPQHHVQTFGKPNRMSALPPKADIRATHSHVCNGPGTDTCGPANSADDGAYLPNPQHFDRSHCSNTLKDRWNTQFRKLTVASASIDFFVGLTSDPVGVIVGPQHSQIFDEI
jgi:hypothetical protein